MPSQIVHKHLLKHRPEVQTLNFEPFSMPIAVGMVEKQLVVWETHRLLTTEEMLPVEFIVVTTGQEFEALPSGRSWNFLGTVHDTTSLGRFVLHVFFRHAPVASPLQPLRDVSRDA